MTPRERFVSALRFEEPVDRLPVIEWAAWWDQTIRRWETEGLPTALGWEESVRHFGLDVLHCVAARPIGPGCPAPSRHGGAIVADEASYDAVLPFLYQQASIDAMLAEARSLKDAHERGDIAIRVWLDGFFWFPRTLFGIENHLYSFYDQPDLMHRMNSDLADFNMRAIDALLTVLTPDMVGLAEDMSYNNGPMLSEACFAEFLLPYYHRLVPKVHSYGVPVLLDSDGDVESMIPWLQRAGIDGVYPLERQAGVDIVRLRERFPRLLMMGGYDKMVMTRGEAAMRAEFDRLLPVMRSGGYIVSVDHQTPPGVSLADYEIYVRLLKQYAELAPS
ncbi:MAG TPA: uroporphyrinogen decarboxylase family protein [Capsulimonadaceae bacterium]|jgi:hypothetical protein